MSTERKKQGYQTIENETSCLYLSGIRNSQKPPKNFTSVCHQFRKLGGSEQISAY